MHSSRSINLHLCTKDSDFKGFFGAVVCNEALKKKKKNNNPVGLIVS